LLLRRASATIVESWRHGVLEAKGDSGFVFMAAKGGFAAKQGLNVDMFSSRAMHWRSRR